MPIVDFGFLNRQGAKVAKGRWGFLGFGGIDGFEGGLPGGLEVGEGVGFAIEGEGFGFGGLADGFGVEGEFLGVFDEEGEIGFAEKVEGGDRRSPPRGFLSSIWRWRRRGRLFRCGAGRGFCRPC